MSGNSEPNNFPFEQVRMTNGKEQELRPDNVILFSHMGHLAMWDHLFVVLDKDNLSEGSEATGSYIWNDHNMYERFKERAIENGARQFLNLREVAEQDKKKYEEHVVKLGEKALSDFKGDFSGIELKFKELPNG